MTCIDIALCRAGDACAGHCTKTTTFNPTAQQQRIVQIIAIWAMVQAEDITPGMNMLSDLGMDSLDKVELMMELEDAFGILIQDEVAEKVLTVQQAFDLVADRTRGH